MLKKIAILIIYICILNQTYIVAEEMDLENFVREMKEYSGSIVDVEKDSKALVSGEGIDEKGILIKIANLFIKEVRTSIKDIYIIFVIVILMGVVKSVSIDLDSSVKKITTLAFTLMVSIVSIKIFLVILKIFKSSIVTFTAAFEIAIPFLMTLLIVTGKITTTSIIGPSILFIVQSIGYIVEVIIIPFSIISLVLTIVMSINENVNLNGVIKFFNKTSLVILSMVFGVFLFFLALESNVTVSIDGVYGKTISAIINDVNFLFACGWRKRYFIYNFSNIVYAVIRSSINLNHIQTRS